MFKLSDHVSFDSFWPCFGKGGQQLYNVLKCTCFSTRKWVNFGPMTIAIPTSIVT